MSEMDEDLPRVAKIVKSLLKFLGVEEYEPRVVRQFLELWYRCVVDVLTDAQIYSKHAGKAIIDCDDVKLAIQSKVNSSFSQPPPGEVRMIAHFLLYAFAICGYIMAFVGVEETEEDETSDNALSEQRDDLSQSTEPRQVSFPLVNEPK